VRLTSFVVSRSWASNRLRTALTILGIGLGVAIVVAIHVMDHNTIKSRLRELRADFGRVDFELVPLRPVADALALRGELAAMPDVQAAGVLRFAPAALAAGGRPLGPVSVYGLAPLPSSAFQHYRVESGTDLEPQDGDERVLVGRELAARHGLQVGEWLELAPLGAPRPTCRGGVLVVAPPPPAETAPRAVQVKGVLAHERLGRREAGEVVIGSFALARALAPNETTLFQVNRSRGAGVDKLRATLRERFQVHDERSALLGEAADERAFRNGVKVLGCLALVLGMFVVFQTLSQSLVERLRQVGLLRALGASRRSIAGIFLVDALLLAGLGSALGTVGGLALAWVLQSMNVSTLGMGREVREFGVPVVPVLWTAALGVLFTVAGAAFPLWKARNLPALMVLGARGLDGGAAGYVLRGVNLFLFVLLVLVLPGAYLAMTPLLGEDARETLGVLAQLGAMILLVGGVLLVAPVLVRAAGGLVLWPVRRVARLPAFLAGKALQQNPGRFAAAVCGLAVVLLALLGLRHITAALRGDAQAFGAVAMPERLFLRGTPAPRALLQPLAELPDVRSADFFEGSVRLGFPLSGLAAASLQRDGGPLAGRPEQARRYEAERCVVVSRRLARLRGLAEDQFLSVPTDDGPVAYRVLAVSDAAGFFPDERAWAVAAPRWLHQDFCVGQACVSQIALELEPGADPGAAQAAARAVAPHLDWAKTGAEIVAYLQRDVTRDFFLFDVLLALILALAAVGMVNGMTIAALGRAREIGVLRALGTPARALRGTFLLEGFVVAALAALLALALGVPLGSTIVHGLNQVSGLEAPVVVPWRWFAAAVALAFATGLLAAVLPGLRAVRENPGDAVRYE
jgi:putative ABC transport system permease protein